MFVHTADTATLHTDQAAIFTNGTREPGASICVCLSSMYTHRGGKMALHSLQQTLYQTKTRVGPELPYF